MQPNTVQNRPVKPRRVQYSPLQPSTVYYSPMKPSVGPVQPNTAQHNPLQSRTAQYRAEQPSASKAQYSPLPVNPVRLFIRHRRDISTFLDNLSVYTTSTIWTAHYSPVQPSIVQCSPVQSNTAHYSTEQPSTVRNSWVDPSTAQCCTFPCKPSRCISRVTPSPLSTSSHPTSFTETA